MSGNCYEEAAKYFLYGCKADDKALVHAVVTGQGPVEGIRYGHAFVTYTGINGEKVVYIENLGGQVTEMNYEKYKKIGEINDEEIVVYPDMSSVLRKLLETEHWGPWDQKIAEAVHN